LDPQLSCQPVDVATELRLAAAFSVLQAFLALPQVDAAARFSTMAAGLWRSARFFASGYCPWWSSAAAAMKLQPISETGTGQVQNQHKTLLDAIICRLNYLFEGQLTDSDKLVYVNNVLKGQLLESELLQQQAASSSKEQFANSAELQSELTNSILTSSPP
jgi:hypothetical protein